MSYNTCHIIHVINYLIIAQEKNNLQSSYIWLARKVL